MIKKKYIAIIQKDENSDYGVTFPDFLGCVTAGKTLDEAVEMANEALQFHIDGMLENNEDIPVPLSIDNIKDEYKDVLAFLVVEVKLHLGFVSATK